MSYQTGTASSPTDLLQKLDTWLVGIGWTQDRSAIEGTGWTSSLHKSGNYVHLRAAMGESAIWQQQFSNTHYGLHMYLGTGFNGANVWNNQTAGAILGSVSNPVGVGMHLSAGPFSNYYFFADSAGDNIVVVVEKTPGLFVHLGWGLSIQKAGSYTGGPYFFGTASGYYTSASLGAGIPGFTSTSDCPFVNADQLGACPGFVRADVDAFTGKWIGIWNVASGSADQGFTGKEGDSSVRGQGLSMRTNFPVYAYSGLSYQFQQEQTSAQDGRANLLPLILWALRDSTTTGFSMLGTVPNVFFTNAVGNGFSNADEYVLGGVTYKLFPNFCVVKQ